MITTDTSWLKLDEDTLERKIEENKENIEKAETKNENNENIEKVSGGKPKVVRIINTIKCFAGSRIKWDKETANKNKMKENSNQASERKERWII